MNAWSILLAGTAVAGREVSLEKRPCGMQLVIGLSLLFSAACVPPSDLPPVDYCEEFLSRRAQLRARCGAGSLEWNLFEQRSITCADLQDSAKSGRVMFDSAQAAACLDQINRAPCDFLLGAPASLEFEMATCMGHGLPVTPSVPSDGGACVVSWDCNSGRCTGDGCPGTCQPLPLDSRCGSSRDCAFGLACINSSCRTPDEDCAMTSDCALGQVCMAAACVPSRREGESCSNDCTPGTACVSATSLCGSAAPSRGGSPGDSCSEMAPCAPESFCGARGACQPRCHGGVTSGPTLLRNSQHCGTNSDCQSDYCNKPISCEPSSLQWFCMDPPGPQVCKPSQRLCAADSECCSGDCSVPICPAARWCR